MDLYRINGRDSRKDSLIVIVAAALSLIIGLSSGFPLGCIRRAIQYRSVKLSMISPIQKPCMPILTKLSPWRRATPVLPN